MTIGSLTPNNLAISRPKTKGLDRDHADSESSSIPKTKTVKNDSTEVQDLHQHSLPKSPKKRFQTLAESTQEVQEKNVSSMRDIFLGTATALGVSASSFAFLTRIFSSDPDKKDCFAMKVEKFAKRSTAGSYSIFALINTLRAIRAKDVGLAVSNFLEIPISIFSGAENLTLNRGLSIGLGNIVMEAQKIYSKISYSNAGESVNYLMKSLKKTYQVFKSNPVGAITDTKHGTGAIIFSAITALSPLVKKLTGSNFLAYNFRHWPGILQELGKIDRSNLRRGAFNYWACGIMMFMSSAINLSGSMFKKYKHTSEILTWIPNVLGRRLLAAANIYRETSKDRKAPAVNMSQAFKFALKEVLHQNGKYNASVQKTFGTAA